MPKIERSVAYTFDAYSGGLEAEPIGEGGGEQIFFIQILCRGCSEIMSWSFFFNRFLDLTLVTIS